MPRCSYRLTLTICLAVLAVLAAPGAALAAPDSGGGTATASKRGDLSVRVAINRFVSKDGRTVAKGTATAQLVDYAGHSTVLRLPVTLTAKGSGSCRVLALTLDQLTLNLLGLNVDLSKVELKVTGKPNGGVLGSLFCKLARAKVKTSAAAAARRLNAHLRRHPLRPLAFSVPVSPGVASAAVPTPTCPVLNLVLGPLNLDLLGLVVDLNKVNLVVTATPGGGALGNLFCTLSK
jgi:hypothetical protein